jgi:arylsulfatase A-like enzyme
LENEVLLSTLLQSAGYRTGLVGKWHATTDSSQPQRGFDYWFSYDVAPAGWQNQYQHQGKVYFSEQGNKTTAEGFQSEALTDKAIEFMKQGKQEPFFLFLGYVDTHAPFENQPADLVDPLLKKNLIPFATEPLSTVDPRGPSNGIPKDHHQQLAHYYAGVEMMDQQIGRVLEYLRHSQILEHTLIIYTSDHGHMNGQHGLYGKGNATRPQNFYQESILVPLTMTWLARVAPGHRYSQPVGTCDLFHTILETAQITIPPSKAVAINSPGQSVFRFLDQSDKTWPGYKFCEMGNARMIASKEFKYIMRFPPLVQGGVGELYDLTNDPDERHNLIDAPKYQQELQTLRENLNHYFEKYSEEQHSGKNWVTQPPANGNEQWRNH